MIRCSSLVLCALALAGCGQKGPLYLPDARQGEVVTRPARTTSDDGTTAGPSNSPSTPDSPDRAASPAPEVGAPAGTPPDDSKEKDKQQQPPK